MNKQLIKILAVEDNEVAQMVINIILKNLGCLVDIADTGKAALNLFRKNKYDLMLVDIGLPDMNGLEICENIRQFENTDTESITPIVLLSAYSDENYKKAASVLKINHYIEKPFTEKKCIDIFEQLIPNFKECNNNTIKNKIIQC